MKTQKELLRLFDKLPENKKNAEIAHLSFIVDTYTDGTKSGTKYSFSMGLKVAAVAAVAALLAYLGF